MKIIILILFVFLPNRAFPTGACCVIGKGTANKFALSLSASVAKNHENLNNEKYNLSQYALILKFNYPLFKNFNLQVQAGVPIRTLLENQLDNEFRGSLGFNIGISAGYLLPEIIKNLELFVSAGYTITKSYLDKENGSIFNQEMNVSELQGVLIGEYKVTSDLFLFTGLRVYGSKIDLSNDINSKSGSHLGSTGYLFGIRYSVNKNFDLSIESSLGHTKLGSIGLMYYL
jgi:hypothetical protein